MKEESRGLGRRKETNGNLLEGLFQSFLRMDAVMITVFFMLSGCSLYYVYSGQDLMILKSMKRFLTKRVISILPTYFVIALLYTFTQGKESLLQNLELKDGSFILAI